MKTKFDVLIDADRDAVWATFDDADNIAKWQPTLKSFTHKSGTAGEVGAVAELVYEENGRPLVLSEIAGEGEP